MQDVQENYYQCLFKHLDNYTLYVYPILLGTYFWEFVDNSTILLYEYCDGNKHLRCGFTNNVMLSDNELSKYGKFVLPRVCNSATIMKALKKLDENSINGCCIVKYSNSIEILPSFKCWITYIEFKNWLLNIALKCESFDNLHDIVENANLDNIDIHHFVCKHFLYILYKLRDFNGETDLLQHLINFLKDEKKNSDSS